METKNTKPRSRKYRPEEKTVRQGFQNGSANSADITLKILATMGVARGVRFLDRFGKSIFNAQRAS